MSSAKNRFFLSIATTPTPSSSYSSSSDTFLLHIIIIIIFLVIKVRPRVCMCVWVPIKTRIWNSILIIIIKRNMGKEGGEGVREKRQKFFFFSIFMRWYLKTNRKSAMKNTLELVNRKGYFKGQPKIIFFFFIINRIKKKMASSEKIEKNVGGRRKRGGV